MIHGLLKNAETNTISNASFLNSSCDHILLDLAQHVSASERMVCYFDVTSPTPVEDIQDRRETKICTGNGFRPCTVELFDYRPLYIATKPFAHFERDVPSPNT
jgi:hypothetical protein